MPNPFDEEKHQKALKSGISVVKEGYHFPVDEKKPEQKMRQLTIERMHAADKGNGFGRALYRQLMKYTIDYDLQLWTDAAWDSHLFHLYMGMIPKDRQISYVINEYGSSGLRALNKSIESETMDQFIQHIEKSNGRLLEELILIFKEENEEFHDIPPTAQDVFANKDFMISLKEKEVSYITYEFIPQLISNLHSTRMDFGGAVMYMSMEGQSRWQEAIIEKKEFKKFDQFEHLHRYMRDHQKQELTEVLYIYNVHNNVSKINAVKQELKLSIQLSQEQAASEEQPNRPKT